jgi:hypothetical protein
MEANPMDRRAWLSLAAIPLLHIVSYAQPCSEVEVQATRSERFVVIVTTKSGSPVSDLQEQDFKVFDNNSLRPIKFLKVVNGSQKNVQTYPVTGVSRTRQDSNTRDRLGSFPRYEITFSAAPALRPKEYHEVGIWVGRPDLEVWTRQGYYAQCGGDQKD